VRGEVESERKGRMDLRVDILPGIRKRDRATWAGGGGEREKL
jgi:hypothetical protein